MEKHLYSSFEEIDLQLEILRTEISLEKAHIAQEYEQAKNQLSIFSLVGSLAGGMAKKAVIFKILKKFLK